MCEVLDREYEAGRAQGINEGKTLGMAEGKAEGKAEVIYSLVHDGDITKERGAERLGITIEELNRRMAEKC